MSNANNPPQEDRLFYYVFLFYALLFFLFLSTSTKASANATCSWPVVHHDSRLTARADCIGPQTNNVKWIYDPEVTVGGVRGPVVSDDGTIYYCIRDTNIWSLHAVSSNGKLKWSYIIDDTIGIYKEYIIDIAAGNDNTIYLSGYYQFIYAIHNDGTLKWKYDHSANSGGGGFINIGKNGTIYIGGSLFAGDNNELFTLNIDGSLKWRFETFYPYTRPAIGLDGVIYAARSGSFLGGGGYHANIAAINPGGSTKWIYECITPNEECLYFDGRLPKYITVGEDERLYVVSFVSTRFGTDYFIGIYDTNNGSLVSGCQGGGYGSSRLALSTSGNVYFSYSSTSFNPFPGSIVTLNIDNDCNTTEIYSWQAPRPSPPILDNADNVYFSNDDGEIICMSSTGETKWTFETNALAFQTGENYVIADSVLYYASGEGKLYAFGQPLSTNYGLSTNSGYTAEPVNTALGNYVYQHTDVTIPGRGMEGQFERGYNSLDTYSGPLGHGWTHSYNIRLTENTENNSVVIKWGDGHEAFYSSNNDGSYTPQYGGVFDTLIKNSDDTFTLTRKDQTKYNFDTSGKLTNIIDKTIIL